MSPARRYKGYHDSESLVKDLRERGYRPVGFRPMLYQEWYLDNPSVPGAPRIMQWPLRYGAQGPWLILEPIQ